VQEKAKVPAGGAVPVQPSIAEPVAVINTLVELEPMVRDEPKVEEQVALPVQVVPVLGQVPIDHFPFKFEAAQLAKTIKAQNNKARYIFV